MTVGTDFNKPADSGGYFKPRDHVGHLILITKVHDRRKKHDDLKNEVVDEVIADLVDLDGSRELEEAVVLSHVGIVNRTRGLDSNILGRIGTAPSNKGNDAFILEDFDEAKGDIAKATEWVNAYNAGAFAKPAEAPAASPAAQAAAASGESTGDMAKKLIAAGLDDATVAQATGLDANTIAAIRNLT